MEDKNAEETKKTADSIVVTDLSKEEKRTTKNNPRR